MRDTVDNAEIALLLEVSSTPKPGNVDRAREYPDLRFEHFIAGAVGARGGYERAIAGAGVGEAFEHAIARMSQQRGGNTQFGAVLLTMPLLKAAITGHLTPSGARAVVESTTVEDAVSFYRAFDHVDVAVDEVPDDSSLPDVRRGEGAAEDIRTAELTLSAIMAESATVDGIAREWTNGFSRTFEAAAELRTANGPVSERAAAVYLELLADEIDTFVRTKHGSETAREVKRRAGAVLAGEEQVEELAAEFVERGINPGTTADIVAGALFVALERGMEV